MKLPTPPSQRAMRGTTAVEFALVSVLLFSLLFGTLEAARAMYLWSTLAQVVGRAARMAAMTDPKKEAQVRYAALFRGADGKLLLGGGIGADNLRIDYLARDRSTTVPAPPCPVDNVINCTNDPLGATCIRFVRVRLCSTDGSDCTPLTFTPIAGLDALKALKIKIPTFATVAPAESLGAPAACNE